jgi:hypothetical protein
MWVAVLVLALAAGTDLFGATLAGVTLPDTQQVGDTKLALNGIGLRTKFLLKIYVAGLYLPEKSSDPKATIAADKPKRLVMQFLHDVTKSRMVDAFADSFNANSPDAKKTLKAEIDRLLGALQPVKAGDQMVFTYVPGSGTTFAINGKDQLAIAGSAFGQVLFAVWLGPEPPTADLKKGLLGQ